MFSRFRPFQAILKTLLIILPFHVLISIFFQYKIGISGFGIYKEILVALLGVALIFEFVRAKARPKLDLLDWAIAGYIGYMVLISLIVGVGLKAIIFGGRYDFEFLLVLLMVKHGRPFLEEKMIHYLRLFAYSTGIAIILGFLVRFMFGEAILIHFGFSPRLSVWEAGGSIPIYHGVEWASAKRFQGIFDGPNQAAYFLLGYLGVMLHVWWSKRDWHWLLYTGLFVIFGLIFLTYSRSALLGVIGGGATIIALNIVTIVKKHWRAALGFLGIIILFSGLIYLKFWENVKAIVLRGGSSKGHYERMVTGIERFREKPLGAGLAESGPAYRFVHDVKDVKEDKYIPESWYIQQLVEGGVIGFVLFMSIMALMGWRLYRRSIFIFGSFVGILIMNFFLHSFEASYVSILLFAMYGFFMEQKEKMASKS